MASEHDQLVQIRIALDIVRQRRHTQLQRASAPSPRIHSRHFPYLLHVFLVLRSRKDQQHDVQNAHHHQRDVDGLVLREVSVGEHVAPVHGRGQDDEPTRK